MFETLEAVMVKPSSLPGTSVHELSGPYVGISGEKSLPEKKSASQMSNNMSIQDGAPSVISWLIISLTIDISTITPGCWSYKPT